MQQDSERKSVLVVDDNRDNRNIFCTILAAAGYRVREAMDGEQAVRIVRSGGVDVVLMDLCMPRMDGWQATRLIRSDVETAHIPIVAVTALTAYEDGSPIEPGEWDEVLFKPVLLQDVLQTVAHLLTRTRVRV